LPVISFADNETARHLRYATCMNCGPRSYSPPLVDSKPVKD